MQEKEWTNYGRKYLRHPRNNEFVTGRVNIVNKRNVIRISIGKLVCDLLQFKREDRVLVSSHKEYKNFILISKSLDFNTYKLTDNNCNNKKKSNFLSVTFRYDFNEPLRLTQTIILDFDMNNNGLLLIDIEKLKWRK